MEKSYGGDSKSLGRAEFAPGGMLVMPQRCGLVIVTQTAQSACVNTGHTKGDSQKHGLPLGPAVWTSQGLQGTACTNPA